MSNIYSVKQINSYIKNMFAQDYMLGHVLVKGEISNLKFHTTGHLYFSLKDDKSAIRCAMFNYRKKTVASDIKEGMEVIVAGQISAYERDGTYMLYAESIKTEGKGKNAEEFERLKQKLMDMGMFAEEYKQPIPAYSRKIGVVTAPTGAAIRDIINVSKSRDPYVQIILYPAIVQGDSAPDSIIKGINALDKYGVDVIIVGRGGGSTEDLWCFNDEGIAEAIFNCMTPTISAVGHEVDYTISDFVADKRAATPSQAAEFATFDYKGILKRINDASRVLNRSFDHILMDKKNTLNEYEKKLKELSPEASLNDKKQLLKELNTTLNSLMNEKLTKSRHSLQIYAERLKGLSPLDKLNQGYSYVASHKGSTVNTIRGVNVGDKLDIYVRDGVIKADVLEVKSEQ